MRTRMILFIVSIVVPLTIWLLTRRTEESAVGMLFFSGIFGLVLIQLAFKTIDLHRKPVVGGALFGLILLPWLIALSAPEISISSFITMWFKNLSPDNLGYVFSWGVGLSLNFIIFSLAGMLFIKARRNKVTWISSQMATVILVLLYGISLFVSSQLYENVVN
ncbi:MAG TPA: hypothetical protein VIM51_03730 [Desulfosporosinus sp.]